MIRSVLSTYRSAFSGLPRGVWLLSAVMVVNRSGSMVLPFISLYLTQERGFSVAAAGRILSLYGIGSAVGSWVGGWASDRIGADRTMLGSLVGSGAGFVWLGFQRDPWSIAAGVLLLSVVAESFRPSCMTAMGLRAPARLRVRAYALLRLAANLGVGIGPAIGGILALYDYLWLFLVDAATCWVAAGLFFWKLPGGQRAAAEDAEEPAGARRGSPWTDGPFLALMVLVVALALAFFQIMSTLPVYLREVYRFREDTIGGLLALNALLIVGFEMILIHRVERWSRMLVAGGGALLVCSGFGLMPFGASVPWVAFTVVVWTLGEMLSLPVLNAVVAERSSAANRGRYMGTYTLAYSVAFILAPVLGTWVYGRFGPDLLWLGIGGLGPPLFAVFLALGPIFRHRDGTNDPDRGAA